MSKSGINRKPFAWIAAGVLLQATTTFATVDAASDGDDQWQFGATLYLWTPDIDAKTQGDTDVDISFNKIYKNLDMAFMGNFEGRKGKWSFLLDEVYLDLSNSESGSFEGPILGINWDLDLDVSLKASITTLAGGYNVFDKDGTTFDLIAGTRYTWIEVDAKLKANSSGGPPPAVSRRLKESESDGNWDAIVGGRGQVGVNANWYLPYYLDFGGGQSDLTWQVMAGVGYKYGWGDVSLVYRYLDYQFDSDYLLNELTVKGPVFGATFRF